MKNIKIKKKTIIIAGAAAAVLIAVLIIITAVHMSSRPKINDSVFPPNGQLNIIIKLTHPLCRQAYADLKKMIAFTRVLIYLPGQKSIQ